jgi:phosphoserine phosphatase RsbU/P
VESSILSEISFPDFLDQVQDGLYIVDSRCKILFWNRAAEQLTGFPSSTAVGKSCLDRGLLDHRTVNGESLCTEESNPLVRCMQSGVGGAVPHLIVAASASGKPLPISLSVSPLHGRDGKVAGAVALFHGMRDEYQQRKLAIEIQKRTITSHGFSRNGVRVQTLFSPVDEIGGDFLEAFFLDDHTLIATLADATGHGISASLFTMVYKTLLHAAFAQARTPGGVLERVNAGFLETTGVDGYYIDACLASYDIPARRGLFSAAGHPHGLVFRREGAGYRLKEHLEVRSPMLGMSEEAHFPEVQFELAPEDLLLLSTDGIVEYPCGSGTQFGVDGIVSFLSEYGGTALLPDLLAEVRRRAAGTPAVDDISAVLVSPA